jgi:trehalose 6-phosphate phosphatase
MTLDLTTAPGGRPPRELLRGASLFLDFDGTLVDLAPSPDEVLVTSELATLLDRLLDRLEGRIAILTGRSSHEVEELIGSRRLIIGGHHGLEMRSGGKVVSGIERPPVLDEIVRRLRIFENDHPGVLVEEKPLGVAVHFRAAPSAEEACRTAIAEAARGSGLVIQPGKMVFELRPGGSDKGDALRKLAGDMPFRGCRPVFLGDDLTDEPAFIAARQLGGAGILIGEPRATEATYRLPTVGETIGWLSNASEIA